MLDLTNRSILSLDDNQSSASIAQCPRDGTDLSYNKISTLAFRSGSGSSTAALALAQARVLRFQHNRLSALTGARLFIHVRELDVSNNCIRSVDAKDIETLSSLEVLNLSMNNIASVDLAQQAGGAGDTPSTTWRSSSAASSPSQLLFANSLRVLDLSNNVLRELPNLSCCANLSELFLDHNDIQSLANITERLPNESLRKLTLHSNAVQRWADLTSMTFYAERLATFTFSNNPCLRGIHFSWRIFVGWLLPLLTSVDDQPLSSSEQATIAVLFRSELRRDELDEHLLAALNDDREADLAKYLTSFCHEQQQPLQRGGRQASPTQARSTSARASSIDGDTRMKSSAAGMSNSSYPAAASSDLMSYLASLHDRVVELGESVAVVRAADLQRRRAAAVTIQRLIRGMLVRMKIPAKWARLIRTCRITIDEKRRRPWLTDVSLQISQARLESRPTPAAAPAVSAAPSVDRDDVVVKVKALEMLCRQLWNDFSHVKKFVIVAQNNAARRIQKRVRIYLARKQWRVLKREYDAFTAKFIPPVIKIQSVVRMHLQRKQFLYWRSKEREMSLLKGEVQALKGDVQDMQRTMQTMLRTMRWMEQRLAAAGQVGQAAAPQFGDGQAAIGRSAEPVQDVSHVTVSENWTVAQNAEFGVVDKL